MKAVSAGIGCDGGRVLIETGDWISNLWLVDLLLLTNAEPQRVDPA